MNIYSIVRIGNEYVVQAGADRVLRIASRRRAARVVTDAAELLQQQPAISGGDDPSISRDLHSKPDSPEVS